MCDHLCDMGLKVNKHYNIFHNNYFCNPGPETIYLQCDSLKLKKGQK